MGLVFLSMEVINWQGKNWKEILNTYFPFDGYYKKLNRTVYFALILDTL